MKRKNKIPEIVFDMIVCNDSKTWTETQCVKGIIDLASARQWCIACVDYFNKGLRPCELPRHFVRVELNEQELQIQIKPNLFLKEIARNERNEN